MVLAELLVGAAIADPRFVLLLLAAGGAVGFAVLYRLPAIGVVAVLVLAASLFSRDFLAFEVGPIKTYPFEVVLGGLLLVALVAPRRATWGGTAGLALALFLGLLVLSGALALIAGRAEPVQILNWGRPFALLTLFFVVVRLFPTRAEAMRLVAAGAIVGGIAGALSLFVAIGADLGPTLASATESFVTQGEGVGQLSRVRLPGLGLAYVLFWFAVIAFLEARGPRRIGWGLVLAGDVVGITLSFNRNMWIGLLLGLCLMLLLARRTVRRRLATGMAVIAFGAAIMFFLPGAVGNGSAVDPLVQRGSTLLEPGELRDESSLQSRGDETERALEAAIESPLIGIGVGTPFGVFYGEQRGSETYVRTTQRFLHNQYLYLVLVAGIPGLICFLVYVGSVLRGAARRASSDPRSAALGVGLLTVATSALVAIYFSVPDMTSVVGLVTGVIVAATAGDEPPTEHDSRGTGAAQASASSW